MALTREFIENINNLIKNNLELDESLLNEIPGYKIKINTTSDTTMSIKVVVDYKKLDLTKLNEIQKTKPFTKVDYYRNASYYTIKSETIGDGFTVE